MPTDRESGPRELRTTLTLFSLATENAEEPTADRASRNQPYKSGFVSRNNTRCHWVDMSGTARATAAQSERVPTTPMNIKRAGAYDGVTDTTQRRRGQCQQSPRKRARARRPVVLPCIDHRSRACCPHRMTWSGHRRCQLSIRRRRRRKSECHTIRKSQTRTVAR